MPKGITDRIKGPRWEITLWSGAGFFAVLAAMGAGSRPALLCFSAAMALAGIWVVIRRRKRRADGDPQGGEP